MPPCATYMITESTNTGYGYISCQKKKSAFEGMMQVLSREIQIFLTMRFLAYRSGSTGCHVISLHTCDCLVFGSGCCVGCIGYIHNHIAPPVLLSPIDTASTVFSGRYHLQSGTYDAQRSIFLFAISRLWMP